MFKSFVFKSLVLGLAISMVACGSSNNSSRSLSGNVGEISIASIANDPQQTPQEKAEKLALAAEQLFTYQGFEFANDIADQALALDATNLRAQFYKALLGPMMLQKGILVRVERLAAKERRIDRQYKAYIEKLQNETPESNLKSFLFATSEPNFANENDILNFVGQLSTSMDNIRLFAKNNKSKSFVIHASDGMWGELQSRLQQACKTTYDRKTGTYKYDCPSKKDIMNVGVDRADFEVIQHTAALEQIFISSAQSYDLSGLFDVLLNYQDAGPNVRYSVVLNDLLKDAKFGVLRTDHIFSKIKELGLEGIMALRWAGANQGTLCPKGFPSGQNRFGMLFNQGMCYYLSTKTTRDIGRMESVLNGSIIETRFTNSNPGEVYITDVKPAVLLDNPIKDLRSLTPITYDACNQIISVADDSLNGVFINHDLNTVFRFQNSCNF